MKVPSIVVTSAWAVGLPALAWVGLGWIGPNSQAQHSKGTDPSTARAPAAAEPEDERVLQAREEMEIWEMRLSAKKVQLDAAELEVQIERAARKDLERVNSKGVVSALVARRADIGVARLEALAAARRAEFVEARKRFQRARRHLANLERREPTPLPAAGTAQDVIELDRRASRLEQRLDKIQADLDRMRLGNTASRTGP